MSFSSPLRLVLAVIIATAVYFLLRVIDKRSAAQALTYSNLEFLRTAIPGRLKIEKAILATIIAGVLTVGIASAGPRVVLNLPSRDGTIVFCIDTSGSMGASDIAPSRSEAARSAIRKFLTVMPSGTRVGIVAFSSEAEGILSPTSDRDAIDEGISRIPAPGGATAIGDALSLAGDELPKVGRRGIVLLTDGVNNHGADPIDVAQTLTTRAIPVYTIGIGTSDSGQIVPGTNEEAGADLDALRQIAQTTHGSFASASDATSVADQFSHLANAAIREKRSVDLSLPTAITGAIVILVGMLAGLAVGKFP